MVTMSQKILLFSTRLIPVSQVLIPGHSMHVQSLAGKGGRRPGTTQLPGGEGNLPARQS